MVPVPGESMPIDAAEALAAAPRVREIAWDHKDVQLYHLGIGAGLSAADPHYRTFAQ